MIHPSTVLKFIDEHKGYGVFATEFIPKGTITYVKDPLEIEINEAHFESLPGYMQEHVEKYSYIDENGTRIISWDFAKYVNHCCNCNTMSTGYGFEIAIRDIFPGEEITDEYGLFNLTEEMGLYCDKPGCRKILKPEDFDAYGHLWDEKVKPALQLLPSTAQPLWSFIDRRVQQDVELLEQQPESYRSVLMLKYEPQKVKVLTA